MKYDSEADTRAHMMLVNEMMAKAAADIIKRGAFHDRSKLSDNEKPYFDEETPKLKEMVYGSDEYKASLARLKPALDHHYAKNSHHPEHYDHGVMGMDLFDLLEMMIDWKAASERNQGGYLDGLNKSLERFGITGPLRQVLINTAHRRGWLFQYDEVTMKELGLGELS